MKSVEFGAVDVTVTATDINSSIFTLGTGQPRIVPNGRKGEERSEGLEIRAIKNFVNAVPRDQKAVRVRQRMAVIVELIEERIKLRGIYLYAVGRKRRCVSSDYDAVG